MNYTRPRVHSQLSVRMRMLQEQLPLPAHAATQLTPGAFG